MGLNSYKFVVLEKIFSSFGTKNNPDNARSGWMVKLLESTVSNGGLCCCTLVHRYCPEEAERLI